LRRLPAVATLACTAIGGLGAMALRPGPARAQAAPAATDTPAAAAATATRSVDRETLLAAMLRERARGYELAALTNAGRLQSAVLFALVDQLQRAGGDDRPLRIGHRAWYEAMLEACALQPGQAPPFIQVDRKSVV
jgi:hypothetical protein